jgi:peptide/nickel transport system ATP-binding protein
VCPYDRRVRVTDLVCELDGVRLLDGVAFAARAGGSLALLGPSGAGKSLALRCLLGLAPVGAVVRGTLGRLLNEEDAREVSLADVRALAALRGRGVTLLPQQAAASLDPVRRVEAQLAELLRLHANAADTPGGLLAEVGLPAELLRRHPLALSGGQAQRVALALALACRPAVLLADEPTSALDNVAQARMLALLGERCAARGVTLVLVTHDLAAAASVCRDAAVLAAGRVVEAGALSAMISAPRHPVTRALVGAARRADALWAGEDAGG